VWKQDPSIQPSVGREELPTVKIILAGIEYVGTTTMANSLRAWKNEAMGEPSNKGPIHDHFKLPHTSGHPDDTTPEEQQQILNLSPKLKEMYHRYSIYYHLHHYAQADELTVGLHIEEAIYARRYFGYGRKGEPFDREVVFDQIERRIKQITSDPIIIVHMTADADVILRRMSELSGSPQHSHSPLLEEDVPEVMSEYERLIARSDIGPKIHVDTSTDTVGETLGKIVELMEPHFTEHDRERIRSHSG
jgi:thymidylate kinase